MGIGKIKESEMDKRMKISWITPSSFVDVDLPIVAELQKEVDIYWQIVVFGRVKNDLRGLIESQLDSLHKLKYEYVEIPYRVYDLRALGGYCKLLKKAKVYK